MLEIGCVKCNNFVLKYQKDGVGSLIRLYLDRISNKKDLDPNSLKCSKCGNLLGVGIIYKPENRPAYSLVRGAYNNKKVF